jgi:hypothetical protein
MTEQNRMKNLRIDVTYSQDRTIAFVNINQLTRTLDGYPSDQRMQIYTRIKSYIAALAIRYGRTTDIAAFATSYRRFRKRDIAALAIRYGRPRRTDMAALARRLPKSLTKIRSLDDVITEYIIGTIAAIIDSTPNAAREFRTNVGVPLSNSIARYYIGSGDAAQLTGGPTSQSLPTDFMTFHYKCPIPNCPHGTVSLIELLPLPKCPIHPNEEMQST